VRAFDFLQDAQPALDRRTDLEPHSPGERARERLSAQDQLPASFNLKGKKRAPCVVAALLGNVPLGYAVARHLVLRQVDPALGEVDLDVLPEVDELQRRA